MAKFRDKEKEMDTVSQIMNFRMGEEVQFAAVLNNLYFRSAVIYLPEYNLDVKRKGKKFSLLRADYHHAPYQDAKEQEFASAQELTESITDSFPLVRVSVTVNVPGIYKRAEKRIERKSVSRQASAGRKLSKRKRFSTFETEYCKRESQLYSRRVALSMDTRLTQLNLNTLVLGGSGAGKSRFFVIPNLLQANCSYVVTDPSGELMLKVGKYLESQGYEIRCLNIEDMGESMRYNPFAYVYEDSDIPVMVDALISNIEGPKKGGSGDNKFWDETSRTLLIAICGYLFETQPMEKRNFNNVVKLIDMMDVEDDRAVAEDELDKLFNDLELANPSSYAVSNYKVIKSAGTGKTAQNIVISTLAIFARFFKLDKIANLTYKDELHLEEMGRKKVALFIVTPQGDTTYNFLASELYTQLFDLLYKQGSRNAKKKGVTDVSIDVPVRCLIDEAANVGVIPHLPEKLSTMRKYGISCCLIYQNQAQIKSLMKDDWETIAGNCDTMLFLGGIDSSTVKLVSERLGKGTIGTKNQSLSSGSGLLSMGLGSGKNNSTSLQSTGRNLMDTNELEQLPLDKCIVFTRSMKPFKDDKYPLEKHPAYKYSGEASDENAYIAGWHLEIDRALMASLNIKQTDEEGYTKPERKPWVSEEDVKRVEKEHQLRRDAYNKKQKGGGQKQAPISDEQKEKMMENFFSLSVTNKCKPVMTDEQKKRVQKTIDEKRPNLSLSETARLWMLPEDKALEMIELKSGFVPDSEFGADDFKIDLFKVNLDLTDEERAEAAQETAATGEEEPKEKKGDDGADDNESMGGGSGSTSSGGGSSGGMMKDIPEDDIPDPNDFPDYEIDDEEAGMAWSDKDLMI